MHQVVFALAGYLIGSIPSAYLIGRAFGHLDIRRVGTGNVGATNVFRQVGRLPGILTGLADVGKGVVAVSLARSLDASAAPLVSLLGAVVGHNWPVWLRFQGGGGLATFGGGLALLLSLWHVVFLATIWGLTYLISRHKYFSSLFMCLLLPIWLGISQGSWDYITFGAGSGLALGVKQFRAWLRYGRERPAARVNGAR